MIDTRIRYIIQHKDGHYVDVRLEKHKDFMRATRWNSVDEIDAFLHGHYKPDRPDDYRAVPVKITYELEENEDVQ